MAARAALCLALILAVSAPAAGLRAMISTEYIRSVVRAHLPEIRACYDRGLATRPDLAGRVTLRFTIAPDGHVPTAVVTSSTLGEPAVEACIVDQVLHFVFPPLGGGETISVNYPFVFQSEATN